MKLREAGFAVVFAVDVFSFYPPWRQAPANPARDSDLFRVYGAPQLSHPLFSMFHICCAQASLRFATATTTKTTPQTNQEGTLGYGNAKGETKGTKSPPRGKQEQSQSRNQGRAGAKKTNRKKNRTNRTHRTNAKGETQGTKSAPRKSKSEETLNFSPDILKD